MNLVFLNGSYINKNDAKISIFDRGFLFADALYEVIPLFEGKPFALEQHIQRLINGLESIQIPNPYHLKQWTQIIQSLLNRNDTTETTQGAHIYLQVTRGSESTRTHRAPVGIKPTVVAFIQPNKKPQEEIIQRGLSAITIPDPRREQCSLKSTSLIANILALNTAIEYDATETIFIHNGLAVEGTQSNIFVVKDDVITTPPPSNRIVCGVTRDIILALLSDNNHHCEERDIPEAELSVADEIWISGSIKGVYPITKLNNNPVHQGIPGPLWGTARSLLSQHIKDQTEAG